MKIEHKFNRHSFLLTVKTDDATIETDLSDYVSKTKSYHIPKETIDNLMSITTDALEFNNYTDKEFVTKLLQNLNKTQSYEALVYLCESLGEKLVE